MKNRNFFLCLKYARIKIPEKKGKLKKYSKPFCLPKLFNYNMSMYRKKQQTYLNFTLKGQFLKHYHKLTNLSPPSIAQPKKYIKNCWFTVDNQTDRQTWDNKNIVFLLFKKKFFLPFLSTKNTKKGLPNNICIAILENNQF